MLRLLLTALIITLVSSSAFAADEAQTQEKALKIAVVDVQQLMSESKAAKSIQSQGQDMMKKYQSEIDKMEKALKEQEKKVTEAKEAQDIETFKKEFQAFQEKLQDSKKKTQELSVKNDKSVAEALNKIREEIVGIVGEMAEKNGYDVVITRANVVIVSKEIDITAEVLKKLDKKLSSVKVK